MARVNHEEWVPSYKSAGKAYAAILNGMGVAFKASPFKVNCKITCTKYDRQINLQWPTRCIVFTITRQGEIWMSLYGNYIEEISELYLTKQHDIIHGRGGWEKALSSLVAKWIRMASKKDSSYEQAVNMIAQEIDEEEEIDFELDDLTGFDSGSFCDDDAFWDSELE